MYALRPCGSPCLRCRVDNPLDTDQPDTPPSDQDSPQRNPAFYSQHHDADADADEQDHENEQTQIPQKKGGYDSRIQQILYENPELEIIITDAGKSSDGNFIAYRIVTGVRPPKNT